MNLEKQIKILVDDAVKDGYDSGGITIVFNKVLEKLREKEDGTAAQNLTKEEVKQILTEEMTTDWNDYNIDGLLCLLHARFTKNHKEVNDIVGLAFDVWDGQDYLDKLNKKTAKVMELIENLPWN